MPSLEGDLGENDLARPEVVANSSTTAETTIEPADIEHLSRSKGEPEWMRMIRLRALRLFDELPMAEGLTIDMADIDVQDIGVGERPQGGHQTGPGVTSAFESEVVHHNNRGDLDEQGILFCDLGAALHEHPHLVEKYFGTVVAPGDDKVSALNTAAWSGGSFVYVPPGVEVEVPLQTYVGVDAARLGQFGRTLIIADEGSTVHYIEGCSAPVYSKDSLHAAVVEIIVKPHARVIYTAIQNWLPNVSNLATKRARVEAHGHVEWIDGNIGSKLSVACPAAHLIGEGASVDVFSVAYSGDGQHQRTGATVVHAAPNTTSNIVSRSISKDGGITTYSGHVRVEASATGATSRMACDALRLDEHSVSEARPHTEVDAPDAQITDEVTVSEVADEQLFYLMSRGLSDDQALGVIVNGFIGPITNRLPLEYAVEWSRLIELQMQGAVG